MIFTTLVLLAIQMDCGDELAKLPKRPWYDSALSLLKKVGSSPTRLGIPAQELAKVLDLPNEIDGDVATLASTPELRIFGIPSVDGTRIEFLNIYAFSKFPHLIATIYIDTKPRMKPIAHFEYGEETAFYALQSQPKLIDLLQRYGYLKINPASLPEIKKQTVSYIEMELTNAENLDIGIRSLDEIRSAAAQIKVIPPDTSLPATKTEFGGWLPGDHYALAIIEETLSGRHAGKKIFLNLNLKRLYHRSWPDLAERIQMKGDFRIEWLKLSTPQLIELEPQTESRTLFLLFADVQNHPKGLPFYRIDLATGKRLTEKPTLLARPLSD